MSLFKLLLFSLALEMRFYESLMGDIYKQKTKDFPIQITPRISEAKLKDVYQKKIYKTPRIDNIGCKNYHKVK